MKRLHGLLVLAALLLLEGCASLAPKPSAAALAACSATGGPFAAAADANRASLDALDWSPLGAAERGWRVYAVKIGQEIGTPCGPESEAFAARLGAWGAAHGLAAEGVLDAASFDAMKTIWQQRRAFVGIRARGICPDPPADRDLARVPRRLAYMDKEVRVRRDALRAYRRMRFAARRDLRQAHAPADSLQVFSGFRSPDYDAERCAREQNCDGVVRAQCSAHRTGAALDLVVGAAEGFAVDSSNGANRLVQTEGPAYRWLVANAGRFGFVNYVFEPWHWEWVGRNK